MCFPKNILKIILLLQTNNIEIELNDRKIKHITITDRFYTMRNYDTLM